MTLKQRIKIECIKKDISIKKLVEDLGMSSRQLMYHHIDRNNKDVILKIEKILKLKEGILLEE
ncbi:MAG: hypothetical protein ACRCXY_03470 [Fusobacteriaceae bacterium]